jgi:HPt (histidine-containing phosphotransfer) domain-containing protein
MSSLDHQTTQETSRRLAQAGALALAVFSVVGLGLFFLRRIDAARTQLQQAREEAWQASRRLRALERRAGLHRTTVVMAKTGQPADGSPAPLPATGYDYAAAIALADREVVGIIAGLFIQTAPEQIALLGQLLTAGKAGDAWRLAHALRSTLEAFHAEPAVALAGEIEQCCQRDALAGAQPVLDRLEREVSALCSSLKLLAY